MMRGRALTTPCHDPGRPGEEVGTDYSILIGLLGPILRFVRGTRHLYLMEFQCCLPRQTAEACRRCAPRLERFLLPPRQPKSASIIERACRVCAAPLWKNVYQELGYVGKKKLKIILGEPRGLTSPAVRALLLLVLITGCKEDLGEGLQSGQVLAWQGLQGRWVGPVVPTEHACGATTQGLMSIGDKGFALDPFQSTTVVRGELSASSHLNGRLVRQGPDHQDLSISFDAMATGNDAINGTLQSGRCHWMVTLHRG
jgi:hypothetical protein